MSHYETLGIPRTASADEVKQAFRRRASAEHPDKGGDVAAMASVNRAYETLSDPERRARYDASGLDDEVKPAETEARDMLLQLFNATITNSDGNWLREVSEMLGKHRAGLLDAQRTMSAKLERLVKRTGRIRVKAGENLVKMLLDQQIQALNQNIANAARAVMINKTASAMLTAYEQDEERSTFEQSTFERQFIDYQRGHYQRAPWT